MKGGSRVTDSAGQVHTQTKIIGIAGGLGPYAHIDFERKLLECARDLAGVSSDQEYPEWVLSSIPSTPDRTEAILAGDVDPAPSLLKSLRRLERAGADFVAVPCNTAHYYLGGLRGLVGIPVLDMVSETVERVRELGTIERVGILATTGTLHVKLYHDALLKQEIQPVSLLDAPDGEQQQQALVMDAIYGADASGGIKAFGNRPDFEEKLEAAAAILVERGAQAVLAGCTEIPLSLRGTTVAGVPLVDPTRVLAELAIRKAYGIA